MASKKSIVTVEEIVDEFDPRVKHVIPSWVVSSVAEVPLGTHPSYAHGYSVRDNDFYLAWDVQSPDFKRMSEKWTAIIQAAQSLDREGVIDWSALCTAFVSTIDPNIAERIIRPAQQGQQQIVQDEQQDLAQIFAGIPKNIKPGTPPQIGLQVIQQYLQQPDVQQRYQQDQPFRERLDARAKQYQFQMQQQQNAVIGRLGAAMPGPMPATTSR